MTLAKTSTPLLGEERAEYGKQIVSTVAVQLSAEHGRGFNRRNLYNMLRFAELFPDEEIVHALRTQLTWTHLRELIAIDDPLKRQFYTEMCRVERWATRTLKAKVGGMLYERTAIAERPDATSLSCRRERSWNISSWRASSTHALLPPCRRRTGRIDHHEPLPTKRKGIR